MSNATGCAMARSGLTPASAVTCCPAWTTVPVLAVDRDGHRLQVRAATGWRLVGCPYCGVATVSRGRWTRAVHDAQLTLRRVVNLAAQAMDEVHRRIACGYCATDDHRLRMLLVAGGLALPPDLR
jgi:hypothetical protein